MDRKRENADADSAVQLERFKEAARVLGCDGDEAAFDEMLKAIAGQKPKAVEEDATGDAPKPVAPRGRRKRA